MIDSRAFGYVPTVTLLALALMTPLPWRRRGRALAWGLAAVQAVVALRVGLYIALALTGPTLAALEPSPLCCAALEAATATVSQSTLASYVLPLVIWAVTTLRSGDWQRLLGEYDSGRPARS